MNTNAPIHQSEIIDIQKEEIRFSRIMNLSLLSSFFASMIISNKIAFQIDPLKDREGNPNNRLANTARQHQQLIGIIEIIFTIGLIAYLKIIFMENNILKYILNVGLTLTWFMSLMFTIASKVTDKHKIHQYIEPILRFIFYWTYYITNSLLYISCISMLLLTFIVIMIIQNKITINYNIFYHLAIMSFIKFIINLFQLMKNKMNGSKIRTITDGKTSEGSLYQFTSAIISFITFSIICSIIIHNKLCNAYIIIITTETIIPIIAIISLIIGLILILKCPKNIADAMINCARIILILLILQSMKQSIIDQYKVNIVILVIIATFLLLQLRVLFLIPSGKWLFTLNIFILNYHNYPLDILTFMAIVISQFYINNINIINIAIIITGLCFAMKLS